MDKTFIRFNNERPIHCYRDNEKDSYTILRFTDKFGVVLGSFQSFWCKENPKDKVITIMKNKDSSNIETYICNKCEDFTCKCYENIHRPVEVIKKCWLYKDYLSLTDPSNALLTAKEISQLPLERLYFSEDNCGNYKVYVNKKLKLDKICCLRKEKGIYGGCIHSDNIMYEFDGSNCDLKPFYHYITLQNNYVNNSHSYGFINKKDKDILVDYYWVDKPFYNIESKKVIDAYNIWKTN